MSSPQVPKTDSIEELARFWDTHDLTELEDQLVEVTEPVFEPRPATTLSLRLEPDEAAAVARIAQDRDVEKSEVLREWVLEGLSGHRVRTCISSEMEKLRSVNTLGPLWGASVPTSPARPPTSPNLG